MIADQARPVAGAALEPAMRWFQRQPDVSAALSAIWPVLIANAQRIQALAHENVRLIEESALAAASREARP